MLSLQVVAEGRVRHLLAAIQELLLDGRLLIRSVWLLGLDARVLLLALAEARSQPIEVVVLQFAAVSNDCLSAAFGVVLVVKLLRLLPPLSLQQVH